MEGLWRKHLLCSTNDQPSQLSQWGDRYCVKVTNRKCSAHF